MIYNSKKQNHFRYEKGEISLLILVDDHEKLVLLTHKRYTIAMDFDDIVKWIRIYITSNKMYEQDYFKAYTS